MVFKKNIFFKFFSLFICFYVSSSAVAEENNFFKSLQNLYPYKYSLSLFKPTYFLPFYYILSPDTELYSDNIPETGIWTPTHIESKAQLSIIYPLLFLSLFSPNDLSIDFSYTWLMYANPYSQNMYLRETNYEPVLHVKLTDELKNIWSVSLSHQSNGKGNYLERSWNRLMFGYERSYENFYAQINTWVIIFPGTGYNQLNHDLSYYMGYENVIFSYDYSKFIFSMEVGNVLSLLQRGYLNATISYPLFDQIKFYLQFYSGYGQSIVEYNHKTISGGFGISFNDWL